MPGVRAGVGSGEQVGKQCQWGARAASGDQMGHGPGRWAMRTAIVVRARLRFGFAKILGRRLLFPSYCRPLPH